MASPPSPQASEPPQAAASWHPLASTSLPVVETFHSLQGEGVHAGRSAFCATGRLRRGLPLV